MWPPHVLFILQREVQISLTSILSKQHQTTSNRIAVVLCRVHRSIVGCAHRHQICTTTYRHGSTFLVACNTRSFSDFSSRYLLGPIPRSTSTPLNNSPRSLEFIVPLSICLVPSSLCLACHHLVYSFAHARRPRYVGGLPGHPSAAASHAVW